MFVQDEYEPAAREEIACTSLPDGEAHYRACLRVHTSTNMTAEEIHELGKKYGDSRPILWLCVQFCKLSILYVCANPNRTFFSPLSMTCVRSLAG